MATLHLGLAPVNWYNDKTGTALCPSYLRVEEMIAWAAVYCTKVSVEPASDASGESPLFLEGDYMK